VIALGKPKQLYEEGKSFHATERKKKENDSEKKGAE